MADSKHFERLSYQIGHVFTPRTPINERDLFAGRVDQLRTIVGAVSQRGCHGVLFGERGVGKTSLANVLTAMLPDLDPSAVAAHVTCAANDDFNSIWRKVFGEIQLTTQKAGPGFKQAVTPDISTLAEMLPEEPSPHDVRKILESLGSSAPVVLILDEFDRIDEPQARTLIADTIKTLSDGSVSATILVVGVADSVDALIQEHQSIERAIVQIPMPRMSSEEISQIIAKGFARLGCEVRDDALSEILRLSQGLPHIAHLLGLHSGLNAFKKSSEVIALAHVKAGTIDALNEWHQSVRSAYNRATRSNQPGHIYKEVLLACALADKDESGFFTAAGVRAPLRRITGKDHDIPNYAQHLKKFSETGRGEVLDRMGESRRIRYRFGSPMMHAYVVMRGIADELLTSEVADEYLVTAN